MEKHEWELKLIDKVTVLSVQSAVTDTIDWVS